MRQESISLCFPINFDGTKEVHQGRVRDLTQIYMLDSFADLMNENIHVF